VLLFVALLGIQLYFFKNAYDLKKNTHNRFVQDKIFDLEANLPYFKEDSHDDIEVTNILNFQKGKITKEQFRDLYILRAKKVEPQLTQFIDSIFAPYGFHVAIKKEITSIYSRINDSLILNEPLLLYYTKDQVVNKKVANHSRWETSSSSSIIETSNKKRAENYKFYIDSERSFEILNLRSIIFKELALLFSSSLIILIAVLCIYYLTYRNYIAQNRKIHMLYNMVDIISHEFKTPIATLKIASKNLQKEPSEAMFLVVDRQIKRLEHILDSVDIEQQHTVPQQSDAKDIEMIISDFLKAYPAIKHHLSIQITEPLRISITDLQSIILNLMGNAIKYKATEISSHFELQGDHFYCWIKDNGMGIEQKYHLSIFDKFFRIQAQNRYETSGLGLGLYIVQQIVQQYQGSIYVESEIGQGATFYITLKHGR